MSPDYFLGREAGRRETADAIRAEVIRRAEAHAPEQPENVLLPVAMILEIALQAARPGSVPA